MIINLSDANLLIVFIYFVLYLRDQRISCLFKCLFRLLQKYLKRCSWVLFFSIKLRRSKTVFYFEIVDAFLALVVQIGKKIVRSEAVFSLRNYNFCIIFIHRSFLLLKIICYKILLVFNDFVFLLKILRVFFIIQIVCSQLIKIDFFV